MSTVAQIALGVTPVIAILMFLYLSLRNGRKFSILLIKSFVAGFFSILIMVAAIYIAPRIGIISFDDLSQTLIYSFIFIGFGGEAGKCIVFKYYILPKSEADTPIHGITFSVMTALGFATAAMLLFIFNVLDTHHHFPYNMYLFLVGPSNICFGIVMGFFVGMTKFTDEKIRSLLTGLAAASFFSGLFTFALVSNNYKLMSLYAFGSTLVMMVLVVKAMFTKIE